MFKGSLYRMDLDVDTGLPADTESLYMIKKRIGIRAEQQQQL